MNFGDGRAAALAEIEAEVERLRAAIREVFFMLLAALAETPKP
jgi:hypothetical protein